MIEAAALTQSSNGETNILCQGKPLYSRYSPSAAAERAVQQIPLEENCIYLIPSPLLGYGIASFIRQLPESSILVGIESDQSLMAVSAPFLDALTGERFICYRTDNSSGLYEVFRQLQEGNYRHCRLIPLNSGYQLNKEVYDNLYSVFQHFLRNYWQNRLTMARMGTLWIKNLISNLKYLKEKDIDSFSTDKAIVLCGAGESLEKTVPLIRENRDSIYLLAVDTAVQCLSRQDIIPDGVVNLEAQFYNLKDFYPLLNKEIDLFSDITAYPSSLRQDSHSHYFFASSFQDTQLHKSIKDQKLLPKEIPPLGSVGVAALYLAGLMTEKSIFITGLDFSYVEGKTHARGTPFHDWCVLQENRLAGDVWYSFSKSRPSKKADTNPPGAVSNPILESYARQLEDIAGSIPNNVYNLAEMGINLNISSMRADEFPAALKIDNNTSKSSEESAEDSHQKDPHIIDALIKKEKEKLESLIDCWDKICSNKMDEKEIIPLLSGCDYLYFHFPDRQSLPNTTPAFLFRVMKEARSLYRRFES
jgi:hypothetical protein